MSDRSFAWWKWALVTLIGLLLWQFIINAKFVTVTLLSALGLMEAFAVWVPAIMALVALALALLGFGLLYRWPGGGLRTIGLTAEQFRKDALLGAAVALVQVALTLFVVIPLLGDVARETLASVSGLFGDTDRLISSIVLVVIYGGIVEELFFRGHVITSVSKTLGERPWALAVGFAVSLGLFAAGHDYQGMAGMIYSLFAAAVWGALFLYTGRLTASITAHALYDLLALLGISLLYADLVTTG